MLARRFNPSASVLRGWSRKISPSTTSQGPKCVSRANLKLLATSQRGQYGTYPYDPGYFEVYDSDRVEDVYLPNPVTITRNKSDAPFRPVELECEYNEFEPLISEENIAYHYEKEYKNDVRRLNIAIAETPYMKMSLIEMCQSPNNKISSIAGQVFAHNIFWRGIRPYSYKTPHFFEASVIERSFGSFEGLKEVWRTTGAKLFGSGYLWLCIDENNILHVVATTNASTPFSIEDNTLRPLYCWDLWEHAYYLTYRNNRDAWIELFWEVINWDVLRDIDRPMPNL